MAQYIKELGEHNVRSFQSSTEFEEKYFLSLKGSDSESEKGLKENPYLSHFNDTQINWLISKTYSNRGLGFFRSHPDP